MFHLGFPGFFRHPICRDCRTEVHGWLWLHHYSWPEGHHHWPYRGKELLTKATWFFWGKEPMKIYNYWPKQHINQEHLKKETKMKNIFATSLECSGLERCGCIYVCILTLLSCCFFLSICRCLQTKGCIYGIGGWHILNTHGLKEWISNRWEIGRNLTQVFIYHASCFRISHIMYFIYCTGTWIACLTHHILYDYYIAGFSKYHCKVYV